MCSNVDDFSNINLLLTAKLLIYHRHSELIVKYSIGLKTLLQQDISEPIFYCDLVYIFKRIDFSDQFKKIIKRYIKVGLVITWMPCDSLHAWF